VGLVIMICFSHMQLSRTQWVGAVIGAIIVVTGIVWLYRAHGRPPVSRPVPDVTQSATTASSTGALPSAASSTPAQATNTALPFPINSADTIASWSFKGAYAGNATLIAQANADIVHLTSLVGGGKYDNYDLYNGIANDYTSLGDGATAYQYYNRALRIYPNKGLVYVNLAHMFAGLGANDTAADAYAKAVSVEPSVLEYHVEQLNFLTNTLPNNTTLITAALTSASNQFGDTAPILSIEAQWLTQQKRYADAIKAWQTVKMLSPGTDTSSIDAAIARLEAK
jgi:tetratricopeptide (TPR) repeat protein